MGEPKDPAAKLDVLVVGAGLYGIQAARTYLDVHEDASLVVLEASNSVGGVWSSERVYDAFWTQTPVDLAEFSDRPLGARVPKEDQYHGFFAAKHLTHYLDEYVDDHKYNGSHLRDRIVFGKRLTSLSKRGDTWHAVAADVKSGANTYYQATRVMDASGLTSIPHTPSIPGQKQFSGQQIHHKDFAQSNVLSQSSGRRLVVLGGAKSAADVAYSAAKAGKDVTWVIRRSGSGPCTFFGAEAPPGPYRNSNESFYNRYMSLWTGSLFAPRPFWAKYWYEFGSGIRKLAEWWYMVHYFTMAAADYDRKDGKENGFYNLKPDTEVFWQNDSSGVDNHPDLFETIAKNVRVYRSDISRVTENAIVLEDETSIDADVIVYATGWDYSNPYLDTSAAAHLGLLVPLEAQDPKETDYWAKLDAQSSVKILEEFPILTTPPLHNHAPPKTTPFRLYKGMLPRHDQSIVFLGRTMVGNNFLNAEVQALWAVAVLDGKISLPSAEDMDKDISRMVSWCRLRYLEKGRATGQWFYYDPVPYCDMLLSHIGLGSHRSWNWKRDMQEPAFAKNLRPLITEYKNKR